MIPIQIDTPVRAESLPIKLEQIRSDLLNSLQPGQVIKATSLGQNDSGLLRLQVGQTEINARIQTRVNPGDRLTLEVIKAGVLPEMRILRPEPQVDLQQMALRTAFIRQQPLDQALQPLQEASFGSRLQQLPKAIQDILQQITTRISPLEELTQGHQLRERLMDSGLFTESRLARFASLPEQDLKAQLLRLAASLRNHGTADKATQAQDAAGITKPFTETSATSAATGRATLNPLERAVQHLFRQLRLLPDVAGAARSTASPTPAATPSGTTASSALSPGAHMAPGLATQAKNLDALMGGAATVPAPDQRSASTLREAAQANRIANLPDPATRAGAEPASQTTAEEHRPLDAQQLRTLTRPGPPVFAQPAPPGSARSQVDATAGDTDEAALDPRAQQVLAKFRMIEGQVAAHAGAGARGGMENALTRLLQDLFQATEGALAKIRYNQLSSVPTEEAQRPSWHLDLPFRIGQQLHNLHLRIREEEEDEPRRKKGGQSAPWTVEMDFELSSLGPIHARVSLQQETVTVVFWAVQHDTHRLIMDHLDLLESALRYAGLETRNLSAHCGVPPQPKHRPLRLNVLDEQA